MGPLVHAFVFVLILINIHARNQVSSSNLLSRLLNPGSSNSPSPVIIIIGPKGHHDLRDHSHSIESGEIRGGDETPDDQEAYDLYNALRSQPQDDLSSGEAEQLQQTKQVLRAALVARCRKKDRCAKSCPKRKRLVCVMVCQEKFDRDNACDEPEEPDCGTEKNRCPKKRKWGKTMPPYWLFK